MTSGLADHVQETAEPINLLESSALSGQSYHGRGLWNVAFASAIVGGNWQVAKTFLLMLRKCWSATLARCPLILFRWCGLTTVIRLLNFVRAMVSGRTRSESLEMSTSSSNGSKKQSVRIPVAIFTSVRFSSIL